MLRLGPPIGNQTIGLSVARIRRRKRAIGVRGVWVGSRTIDPVRLPRLSPRAYRRITLLALLAQVFITVSGAAVRLTGSGLGCSDWPTCENNRVVAPFEYHAMIEFVNRTVTGLVSVAVILAVLGSLLRSPRRRDLTWWSLGLVGGVIGQIVLGGLTVLFELRPPFVIAHFALSMILIWNAFVLHERSKYAQSPALPVVPRNVRILGRLLVVAASITIFTGTIVMVATNTPRDFHSKSQLSRAFIAAPFGCSSLSPSSHCLFCIELAHRSVLIGARSISLRQSFCKVSLVMCSTSPVFRPAL